jgi:hypothetical protein
MHDAFVPNLQVRDVAPEVHDALIRRAESAGQLAAIAATPTIDDILRRIEQRSKGRLSASDVVDAVGLERARR